MNNCGYCLMKFTKNWVVIGECMVCNGRQLGHDGMRRRILVYLCNSICPF